MQGYNSPGAGVKVRRFTEETVFTRRNGATEAHGERVDRRPAKQAATPSAAVDPFRDLVVRPIPCASVAPFLRVKPFPPSPPLSRSEGCKPPLPRLSNPESATASPRRR